ncbi:MAG: hypothetical protein LBV29_00510 [Azoarcus sp.]|jgi:hypothetical protein|nr:hypothetical protein [Azoarcus sp.]
MSSQTALAAKARQCLAKAVPIPGAPAWHLARGTIDNKVAMQNAVDYLTCKAKARMPFTEDEKHFLVELFEAFWWGGKVSGMPEAATLANHYVHGGGKTLRVNPDLYTTSVIVRDTMAAMKAFIKESHSKNIPVPILRSDDFKFRRSTHFATVSKDKGQRCFKTQGHVQNDDGALLAEQFNKRLHYADNRFHLQAFSGPIDDKTRRRMCTRWRVDSIWDYEPFEAAHHISDIPMGFSREHILKIPDGLSQYMTVLGVAQVFKYWAEWHETWDF